jgi:hypothetical protein
MKATIILTAFATLILSATTTPASAQNKNDSSEVQRQKQWIELSKTNKNRQLLLALMENWERMQLIQNK